MVCGPPGAQRPAPLAHRVPVSKGGQKGGVCSWVRLTLRGGRSYNPMPVRAWTGIQAPGGPLDAEAAEESERVWELSGRR
jgi:hypothetical protein